MLPQRRGFQTSASQLFKQKVKEQSTTKTPRKTAGEYRNFRKAAAYSLHHEKATPVVPGAGALDMFTKKALETVEASIPKMVVFPTEVQRSLTNLADFQPAQNHELFNQKATLLRKETAVVLEAIKNQKNLLFTGSAGVGKSTLLAQAHALAKLQNFLVLHLPRAQDLVDGDTEIVHPKSEKFGYLQPMFARRWLKKIVKANKDVLTAEEIKMLKTPSDPAKALNEFMETVKAGKAANGAPCLVSIDNINAWSQQPVSKFFTRENEPIYSGDLQIPKLFRDLFSGRQKLANGSIIASTTAKFMGMKTIDVATNKIAAPSYRSLEEFDAELASDLKLQELKVGALSFEETSNFVKYIQVSMESTSDVASDAASNAAKETVQAEAAEAMSTSPEAVEVEAVDAEAQAEAEAAALKKEQIMYQNIYAETSGNPRAVIRSAVSFGLGPLGL